MTHDLCTFLDWDTEFFGFRVGRINVSRLDPETVTQILAWRREQKIRSLYFLADCGDRATIRLAEKHGFYLVDLRVTLEYSFEKAGERPAAPAYRFALPEDASILKAIARAAYRDTRFYYDEHFPEELCSRLYEVWIEKSITGYAEAVIVIGEPGKPEGYITCHLNQAEKRGKIGLVGVNDAERGRGVGKRLIACTLDWFASQGMTSVEVVTQGRNLSAQRLYQRGGFVTSDVKLWYHHWFDE